MGGAIDICREDYLKLNQQGKQHMNSRQFPQAQACLLKSMKLIRQSYGQQNQMYLQTLDIMTDLQIMSKKEEECLKYSEEYLKTIETIGDTNNQEYFSANYNLGYYCYILRKDDKAIKHMKAVESSQKLTDSTEIKKYYESVRVVVLYCLGDLYRFRKEFDTALQYFQRLLLIGQESKSAVLVNCILNEIGVTCQLMDDSRNASRYFQQRKQLRKEQIGQNYSQEDEKVISKITQFYAKGLYTFIQREVKRMSSSYYKQSQDYPKQIKIIRQKRIQQKIFN